MGKMRERLVRERFKVHLNFFSVPLSVLSYSISIVEKKKRVFSVSVV